jgi:hypothetical protein
MTTRRSIKSFLLMLSLLVIGQLASASAHAAASGAAGAGVQAAGAAQGGGAQLTCALLQAPAQPLELNTVAADGLFKTVAMEKEIFTCRNAAGNPVVIRDLETFIEVIQRANGELVAVRVDLAICNKDFRDDRVSCAIAPLPLAAPEPTPLAGCDIETHRVPADPVQMNTAITGPVVKTIKVEKEWFRCGNRIRDIYVFTEIMERRQQAAGGGETYVPFLRRAFGVVCVKNVRAGRIQSCHRFGAG